MPEGLEKEISKGDMTDLLAFLVSGPSPSAADIAKRLLDDKQPAAKELTCSKLTVVDQNGKPRVVLSFNDMGGHVKVLGAKEQSTVVLENDPVGGLIRLFGANEKRLLLIGGNKDGCQVNVCDPDGNIRAYIGERMLRLLHADYFASFSWNETNQSFGDCVALNMGTDNLAAYEAYLAGTLEDPEFSEADMEAAIERLPEVPAPA